jgi:xanthine dehydrogenase accessory factor
MRDYVLIRGGGDLASGVALRLFNSGFQVVITELAQPLVIRRKVSFGEAVYAREVVVEGVVARLVEDIPSIINSLDMGEIPVVVDPECKLLKKFEIGTGLPGIAVLVDGRMRKRPPGITIDSAPLVIGLGPGFIASENCHAVIETNRGHFLGRVIWEGGALPDTGVPEGFSGKYRERVLRAPADGLFQAKKEICDQVNKGDLIAEVDGQPISAPLKGVLRGLLHPGLSVLAGDKVGDVDPRDDPRYCRLVSDKALAVAGGVLEAVLSKMHQHQEQWG